MKYLDVNVGIVADYTFCLSPEVFHLLKVSGLILFFVN